MSQSTPPAISFEELSHMAATLVGMSDFFRQRAPNQTTQDCPWHIVDERLASALHAVAQLSLHLEEVVEEAEPFSVQFGGGLSDFETDVQAARNIFAASVMQGEQPTYRIELCL